jgi:molecular chaperone GrpE
MYWNESRKPVRRIPVNVVKNKEAEHLVGGAPNPVNTLAEPPVPVTDHVAASAGEEPDWRSLALHLQAEMNNFRRRQTRRADEAVVAERERLLRLTLSVADNLTRALNHVGGRDASLRQGVELTHHELMRLLKAEGVTDLEAVGQPFDPEIHEAVATVTAGVEAGTVLEEVEKGYLLGDKLLRPARVIVAA